MQSGHVHRNLRPHRGLFSPACRRPRCAATSRGASASTSRVAAARRVRATASSRSRCTSCPTCTSHARLCHGNRYTRETLEVKFRGKISDVLALTVDEAVGFFENVPQIAQLKTLQDVGLGYIHLGQPATTLSGGEAQRVKLAAELSASRHRTHALPSRRAHDRASLLPTWSVCSRCFIAWSITATRWSSSSTTWTCSRPPTG